MVLTFELEMSYESKNKKKKRAHFFTDFSENALRLMTLVRCKKFVEPKIDFRKGHERFHVIAPQRSRRQQGETVLGNNMDSNMEMTLSSVAANNC